MSRLPQGVCLQYNLVCIGGELVASQVRDRRPGKIIGVVLGDGFPREQASPEIDYNVMVFDPIMLIALNRLKGGDHLLDLDLDLAFLANLAACAIGKLFAQVQQPAGQAPLPGARRAAAASNSRFARQ